MALKRQLTEPEKQLVIQRQGLRCFILDHPIESEADVEYDHIHPFSDNGASLIDNVAIVCRRHNREKGSLSLSEYRDRLALRHFFEGAKKRRLDDLLQDRLTRSGYGHRVTSEVNGEQITLHLDTGSLTRTLEGCPATGEKFFYAVLPVSVLRNDTDLQPRALEPERLWDLYRHLLTHTQLAPAVCRMVDGQILLFDGQHKAAVQVWAGRTHIDCKVYVNPDPRRLKETNLTAHDKLRQMPFYTSTLIEKYAGLASEDWQAFLESPNPKTEANFVNFMRERAKLSKAEAVKRIRSLIQRNVLEHPDNQLKEYVAEENRARQQPLTFNRLEKTFFAEFIAPPPLSDEFETETYHRDEERENLVRLMNLIVQHELAGKWAPERNDDAHRRAARLFSAGALRAWVPILRDAMAPALQVFDHEERSRLLYRELDDQGFAVVERLLNRLFSHKVWVDANPDLNDLRYDNAERGKEILHREGLSANWILGGDS